MVQKRFKKDTQTEGQRDKKHYSPDLSYLGNNMWSYCYTYMYNREVIVTASPIIDVESPQVINMTPLVNQCNESTNHIPR